MWRVSPVKLEGCQALCLEHSLPSASLKLYIITLYKSQVLPIIDYACVHGLGPTFAEILVGVCPDIYIEDGLSIMESQCRGAQ